MLGSIISGISGVIGGLFGQNSQEKMARENIRQQREFAQHGISWKVADAQRAGIHPIYALGAPTHSFSPVSIGDSLGPGIRQAGQDIGRAINSTSSPGQRMTAEMAAAAALNLEKGGLENELLRTQIARLKQTVNPPLPEPGQRYGIPGQGATAQPGKIDEKTERSGWNPSDPSTESHAIADIGWARSSDNTWALAPSKDMKQRIEDMNFYELQHFVRNMGSQFLDNFSVAGSKGPFPPPPGERWIFNPVTGKAWLVPISGAGKWANQRMRKDW